MPPLTTSVYQVKPQFPPGKVVTDVMRAMGTVGYLSAKLKRNAWHIARVDIAGSECSGGNPCTHPVALHMENGAVLPAGPILRNAIDLMAMCSVLGADQLSNGGSDHFAPYAGKVTPNGRNCVTARLNGYYVSTLQQSTTPGTGAMKKSKKSKTTTKAKSKPRKAIAKPKAKKTVRAKAKPKKKPAKKKATSQVIRLVFTK